MKRTAARLRPPLLALCVLLPCGALRAQTQTGTQAYPGTRPAVAQSEVHAPETSPPPAPEGLLLDPQVRSLRRPAAPALSEGAGAGSQTPLDLALSLGVREEYSDNYERSDGDRQDNWRTVVSPGVALRAGDGPARLELDYRLDSLADTLRRDVNFQHQVDASASWAPSPRIELRLADQLVESDLPRDEEELGLRSQRSRFERNALAAEAQYTGAALAATAFFNLPSSSYDDGGDALTQEVGVRLRQAFGERHHLTLGYAHAASEFSPGGDGTSAASDIEIQGHELTAGLSRQLGRTGSLGVVGRFAARTQQTRERGAETDFTLWSVLPSLGFALRRDLSGTLSLGWSQLSIAGGDDLGAFTALGALRYQRGRVSADLSLRRGFSEPFIEGESVGIVKTLAAEAGLSYRLTPRLTLRLSGFFRENESLATAGSAGPIIDVFGRLAGFLRENGSLGTERDRGSDERWGTSAELRLALGRRLDASLQVARTEFASCRCGGARRTFTEHQVRLALRSRFR
jgi:hypothetical protein